MSEGEYVPLREAIVCCLSRFGRTDTLTDDDVFFVVSDVWGDRTAKIEFHPPAELRDEPALPVLTNEVVATLQKIVRAVSPLWRIVMGRVPDSTMGLYIYPNDVQFVRWDNEKLNAVEGWDLRRLLEFWSTEPEQ